MILSKKENVKPEPKMINDSTADETHVTPAIGNAHVVCQGGFTDAEIEEMAIEEIVYNDVKRAWWIEGAKYINQKFK